MRNHELVLKILQQFKAAKVLMAFFKASAEERFEDAQKLYSMLYDETPLNEISMLELAAIGCNIRNYVKYISYCEENIWNISNISHLKKALVETHDFPEEIITAYANSMEELNMVNEIYFHEDFYSKFFKDMVVADFGCGSGYYAECILKMRPKKLTVIDRAEIIHKVNSTLLCHIGMRENTEVEIRNDINDEVSYDTIWLSEVIHGKQDQIGFLLQLHEHLAPHGRILINELVLPRNIRGYFFKMQMILHSGQEGFDPKIILDDKIKEKFNFIGRWPLNWFSGLHEVFILEKK